MDWDLFHLVLSQYGPKLANLGKYLSVLWYTDSKLLQAKVWYKIQVDNRGKGTQGDPFKAS